MNCDTGVCINAKGAVSPPFLLRQVNDPDRQRRSPSEISGGEPGRLWKATEDSNAILPFPAIGESSLQLGDLLFFY